MEPPRGISLADLELGTWTAEQGIALEVAEWVLGALIGWCSAETARERRQARPDLHRLAELKREQSEYTRLRRDLDIHDPQQVQRVLADYGALARERYQALGSGAD
jgi:hypothetical protein